MSFSTSVLHIALLLPFNTAVENSGKKDSVERSREKDQGEGEKVEGGR